MKIVSKPSFWFSSALLSPIDIWLEAVLSPFSYAGPPRSPLPWTTFEVEEREEKKDDKKHHEKEPKKHHKEPKMHHEKKPKREVDGDEVSGMEERKARLEKKPEHHHEKKPKHHKSDKKE